MASISNISVGANFAGNYAIKARHDMNASIMRLSSGNRTLAGGDAVWVDTQCLDAGVDSGVKTVETNDFPGWAFSLVQRFLNASRHGSAQRFVLVAGGGNLSGACVAWFGTGVPSVFVAFFFEVEVFPR